MELPEDWEAIDVNTMPLPQSETDSSDESCLPPTNKLPPKLKKKRRSPKAKARREQRRKDRKRHRRAPRKTKLPNSLHSFLRQQDYTIERTPVYTEHARQRLQQGRSGEFVTKKNGNAVVVVTVLPSNGYQRRNIESIRVNRKGGFQKYKVR